MDDICWWKKMTFCIKLLLQPLKGGNTLLNGETESVLTPIPTLYLPDLQDTHIYTKIKPFYK